MTFRTAIDISKVTMPPLRHDGCVLLLGSCFSDNMCTCLRRAMVDAEVNPFGTTYNPLSLLECVEWLIDCRAAEAADLFPANGVWNHFMFHSRYSGTDPSSTLAAMNASIGRGHEQLSHCSHLFVTLGTAFVYRLAGEGRVVNNCHKLPSSHFERGLCGMEEAASAIAKMAERVHEFNPAAHIVFTVSPIRHLSDGLAMNHLSKSLLTVAVHHAVAAHPGYCHYFPAFEILNDDLRDYRFYAADMAHPSDVAVNYVWEQFKAAFFDGGERQKAEQCERLSRLLAHRPTSPNAEVVEQFRARASKALADMAAQCPHIAKLDYLKHYITCKEEL